MAPGADHDLDVPASLNGITVADQCGEENCKPSFKPGKNFNSKAFSEPPVETYEDLKQAPVEFVVKNPKRIPTRGWGEPDASHVGLKDFDLPVVDISPLMTMEPDDDMSKKVILEMGKACEEWGFFQAVNHGIPVNLLEGLLEVGYEFFRLPLDEKQMYVMEPGKMEGYGRLDFSLGHRGWHDCVRHTVRPKPSPDEERIPPTYRALLQEYTEGVEKVLQVLWTSLSQHLGLEPSTLEKAQGGDSQLIMRMNYYPKCPEPEKVVGTSDHKDFGWMTVLLQDDVGGLQVQKPGTDVWVDVKPLKGSLVINIANQLEMLSNGRLNSATHRSLVNRNNPRLSIIAFAHPGPNCIISPLQELLEKTGQAPRYKEHVFENYMPNAREDSKKGVPFHLRYEINRN